MSAARTGLTKVRTRSQVQTIRIYLQTERHPQKKVRHQAHPLCQKPHMVQALEGQARPSPNPARSARLQPTRHKCAVYCVPPVPCAPSGSALGVAGFSRSRLDLTRCLRMITYETGTNLMECSQRRSRRLRHPARQHPSLPGHDLDGVGREVLETPCLRRIVAHRDGPVRAPRDNHHEGRTPDIARGRELARRFLRQRTFRTPINRACMLQCVSLIRARSCRCPCMKNPTRRAESRPPSQTRT